MLQSLQELQTWQLTLHQPFKASLRVGVTFPQKIPKSVLTVVKMVLTVGKNFLLFASVLPCFAWLSWFSYLPSPAL